jgi:hypothetical protein
VGISCKHQLVGRGIEVEQTLLLNNEPAVTKGMIALLKHMLSLVGYLFPRIRVYRGRDITETGHG